MNNYLGHFNSLVFVTIKKQKRKSDTCDCMEEENNHESTSSEYLEKLKHINNQCVCMCVCVYSLLSALTELHSAGVGDASWPSFFLGESKWASCRLTAPSHTISAPVCLLPFHTGPSLIPPHTHLSEPEGPGSTQLTQLYKGPDERRPTTQLNLSATSVSPSCSDLGYNYKRKTWTREKKKCY